MKILIGVLSVVGAALVGLGQGTVDFMNSVSFTTPDPTGGDRRVYDVGSPLDPVRGMGMQPVEAAAGTYVRPHGRTRDLRARDTDPVRHPPGCPSTDAST